MELVYWLLESPNFVLASQKRNKALLSHRNSIFCIAGCYKTHVVPHSSLLSLFNGGSYLFNSSQELFTADHACKSSAHCSNSLIPYVQVFLGESLQIDVELNEHCKSVFTERNSLQIPKFLQHLRLPCFYDFPLVGLENALLVFTHHFVTSPTFYERVLYIAVTLNCGPTFGRFYPPVISDMFISKKECVVVVATSFTLGLNLLHLF